MPHFLYHYLFQDLYQPVWPNIVADPFCALLAIFYGIFRIKKHITEEHEKTNALAKLHHMEQVALHEKHHAEVMAKR